MKAVDPVVRAAVIAFTGKPWAVLDARHCGQAVAGFNSRRAADRKAAKLNRACGENRYLVAP